jgi:hypothetical protein
MDDPHFFSVCLIGLLYNQYKCIIVDLCVSKAHVLKLQLVFLVLYEVTLETSVHFRCTYMCHFQVPLFQQTGTGRTRRSTNHSIISKFCANNGL